MNTQATQRTPRIRRRHLAPNRWRQRYIRQRQQDPVVQKGLGQKPFSMEPESYEVGPEEDFYWDLYDPLADYYGYEGSCAEYAIESCLAEILAPKNSLFEGLRELVVVRGEQPLSAQEKPMNQAESDSAVEVRLFHHSQFLRKLAQGLEDVSTLRQKIQAVVYEPADLAAIRQAVARDDEWAITKAEAHRILLFAPLWVRRPSTWSPAAGVSLFSHLMEQFKTPRCLKAEWQHQRDTLRLKWMCWHLLLAQGGSLKRASKLFGWKVTAKFQHLLNATPEDLSPLEMCMLAEVRRLGGDEALFRRLRLNPGYLIDPTEPSDNETFRVFWQETVSWLLRNQQHLTNEQVNSILTWGLFRQAQPPQPGVPGFSWKRRSWRSVLQQSEEFALLQRTPWKMYRWNHHGFGCSFTDKTGQRWTVEELCSGDQLFEEGKAMRHCVVNYASRCAAGYSLILSLRQEGNRCLTLELNPSAGALVQARGVCNRMPNCSEKEAIRIWQQLIFSPNKLALLRPRA